MITTASGTRIFIGGVRAAATNTQAEYEALSWTEIGEVENLGEFGDESPLTNFASLGDARIRKLKAARDAGTLALVVGRDPADAGQNALKAAEQTKFEYAFKVEAADAADENDDNSVFYFGALVSSARNNFGTNDNVVRNSFNLAINTEILEVPTTPTP
jgi:hypothetical protein